MPLIDIHFIEHDGRKVSVKAQVGDSLMRVAVNNNISAIVAECGGGCACATCRCYIAQQNQYQVPKAKTMEKQLLNMANDGHEDSRLACQVFVSETMQDMQVHLPKAQGNDYFIHLPPF